MAIVLGSHARDFKKVFDAANGQLLEVFGMEMVELPNRDKVTMRQKLGMLSLYPSDVLN